jgi:hypothetical protein
LLNIEAPKGGKMKTYRFLLIIAFILIFTACQTAVPPSTPTATLIPTSTSSPTPTSTSTNTPEPTLTTEPSQTPIVLPDLIQQTFSGIAVIYHDSFEYVMQNVAPQGWKSDENYAIWVTEENQLKAQPVDNGTGSGTVFYFSGEKIIPNTGVHFLFKYEGTTESFTLGFDNINSNGERVLGDNFHSVAMEMRWTDLLVYGNQNRRTTRGAFQGSLGLRPDTWYNITLAHDKKHNFMIKVWDPNDPQKQLTHFHTWEDFPTSYYFISWISAKRSLLIDDFTVFQFDEIIRE